MNLVTEDKIINNRKNYINVKLTKNTNGTNALESKAHVTKHIINPFFW